jgi:hypothetical protein
MPGGIVLIKNLADLEAGIDIFQGTGQNVPPFRIFSAAGVLQFQVAQLGSINLNGIATGVQSVSTTPTTLGGNNGLILVDATAGAITLNLPAASVASPFGAIKNIVKIDATTNPVTITAAGADTITPEGYTSIQLISQGAAVTLQANGTNRWFTLPSLWNQNSANLRTVATTPYTVVPSDYKLLMDATGGVAVVNLMAANSVPPGWSFGCKKKDASGNSVTVTRAGADTIEGATTVALATQFNATYLTSDGVGIWYKSAANAF